MRIIDIRWDGWNSPVPEPKELPIPDEVEPGLIDEWLEERYHGQSHHGYELAPNRHIRELELPERMKAFAGLKWHAYRLTSRDDAIDVCRALYWDFKPEMIEALDDTRSLRTTYPCVGMFYIDSNLEGRCAGTPAHLSLIVRNASADLTRQLGILYGGG